MLIFFRISADAQTCIDSLSYYEKIRLFVKQLDVDTNGPYIIAGLPADNHLKAGRLKFFWRYLSDTCSDTSIPVVLLTKEYRGSLTYSRMTSLFKLDSTITYKWISSNYWYNYLNINGDPFLHYYDPLANYHYTRSPEFWGPLTIPISDYCSSSLATEEAKWIYNLNQNLQSDNFIFYANKEYFYIAPVEGWSIFGFDRSLHKPFEMNINPYYTEWFLKHIAPLPSIDVTSSQYNNYNSMLLKKGYNDIAKLSLNTSGHIPVLKFFNHFGLIMTKEDGKEIFGIYGLTRFAQIKDSTFLLMGYHPNGVPSGNNATHSISTPLGHQDSIWLFACDAFRQADSNFLLAELYYPADGGLLQFIRFLPESFYKKEKWSYYKYLYRFSVPINNTEDNAFILSNGEARIIRSGNTGFKVIDTFMLQLDGVDDINIRKIEAVGRKYFLLQKTKENGQLHVFFNNGNLKTPFIKIHSFDSKQINSGHVSFTEEGIYWISVDYFNIQLHHKKLGP